MRRRFRFDTTLVTFLATSTACVSVAGDGGPSANAPGVLTAAAPNREHATLAARTISEPITPADGVTRAQLGEAAPDFTLEDLEGRQQRLSSYRGKIVVLEWFNPSCPFVQYAYGEGPLAQMHELHSSRGIVWLSINSSSPGEEGSDVAENRRFVSEHRVRTPVLFDTTGVVGCSYEAKTTPHVFVVNERGVLVYRGALDNAPLGRVDSTSSKMNYLEAAIADLKSGHAVTTSETRPYGCKVKYARP